MGAVGAPQRSSFLERSKLSSEHVIVVEKLADFRWSQPDIKVITAEQFVAEQPLHRGRVRKVTNLCRSYGYLSMGYYCSLLAEARGDRVTPSVDTILSLQRKRIEPSALAQLNRLIGPLKEIPRSVNTLTLHVFFGIMEDPALAALARAPRGLAAISDASGFRHRAARWCSGPLINTGRTRGPAAMHAATCHCCRCRRKRRI